MHSMLRLFFFVFLFGLSNNIRPMNDLYDDTITTITPVKLSTFLRFAAARENESFSLPTGRNLRVHLQSYMEVAFSII